KINLSWNYYQAPNTPVTGILIARSSNGPITWLPEDPTVYDVGNPTQVPTGITIVYNSLGTATSDANVVNGTTYYYRAYAHDNGPNHNIADPRTASATAYVPVAGIIDDYEGFIVPDSYYFKFGTSQPSLIREAGASYDNSTAIKVNYSHGSGPNDWGGGWGGSYPAPNTTNEITAYDALRFTFKGDGSSNKFVIVMRETEEAVAENYTTLPFTLSHTGWTTVEIPFTSLTTMAGTAVGNNIFNKKIDGYGVQYVGGTIEAGYHYFDNIMAVSAGGPDLTPPTATFEPTNNAVKVPLDQ
ncbi:MAG: carbohydrate binding domain-containing protein, partial [Patescibacteria group bacterium]